MKNILTKPRLALASTVLLCATASGFSTAQDRAATTAPATATTTRNAEEKSDATTHVNKAVEVVRQMERDRDLAALLKKSKGVFVVPDYGRAALGVGARGGAGVLLVRRGGNWSNPTFYNMGGLSAGIQAGVEAGAIALVLNDQKALNGFMQNNKFSLNADAGLTVVNWSAKGQGSAGRGDITVWSDTEGLFGGAAVSVTDINFDEEETSAYYNRRVAARDVISGKVTNPHAAALRQAVARAASDDRTGSMGSSGTSGKMNESKETRDQKSQREYKQ